MAPICSLKVNAKYKKIVSTRWWELQTADGWNGRRQKWPISTISRHLVKPWTPCCHRFPWFTLKIQPTVEIGTFFCTYLSSTRNIDMHYVLQTLWIMYFRQSCKISRIALRRSGHLFSVMRGPYSDGMSEFHKLDNHHSLDELITIIYEHESWTSFPGYFVAWFNSSAVLLS